ncbi:bifunctional hydroxymethylpyrimidine kinase/phosphomethylpyrimidine kinase [Secundilactobacillus oryzae]|uniref:bifunctional hydroxymethylpyrimidine kinase/phosphomethylpyrimidine kinase n=1 Tax=Secundilactobacillus oryzae TaxID=1202668 RepID=UPI000ADDD66D
MAIGYVGSEALVAKLDHYLENNPVSFVVIDPVMGDHGTLYDGFNQSYVEQIRQLSHRADVLTPNWTEAQLLVGDNPSSEATEQRISEVLNRLTEQTKPHTLIVITGLHWPIVRMFGGRMAIICGDRSSHH